MDLTVQVGNAGYHSGETGGVVPETFRIIRKLIDRLDSSEDGRVCDELQYEVPQWKREEAEKMVALSGDMMYKKYGIVDGAKCCK